MTRSSDSTSDPRLSNIFQLSASDISLRWFESTLLIQLRRSNHQISARVTKTSLIYRSPPSFQLVCILLQRHPRSAASLANPL
ncbi:hypothetical protein PGTUg99_013563 [Puccinia graminis f. sp. tritici]|uniref:Uncharacterized protein n=1 Tax=Puccinia graminis f. sp. tritici TaxID=56615 RepID=A0A5B0RPT4_PUCGR|nr:hypothetical protein PGTUg99_013563 [Puccinia graminis f. sp. tritici]